MTRKCLTFWRFGLIPLLASGFACGADAFPKDFVFGAAVAGFQVDPGCPTIPAETCEDRHSDWYHFVSSPITNAVAANHLSGESLSRGPGFYELYDADLARAQSLGLGGIRISIEWSRVFPSSTRGVNGHEALLAIASPAGLDYYKKVLAAAKAHGLRPLVTLHHYTLPDWMHDAVGCNQNLDTCSPRGWLEPDITEEIAKYAGFVAEELGGEIDHWATENEPLAVVVPGFIQPTATRTNPPARAFALAQAQLAAQHMIEAHAKMVDAVRLYDQRDADGDGNVAEIGLVFNVTPFHPKDPAAPLDQRAARNLTTLFNWIFLDGVVLGKWDPDFDGNGEVRADLAGRADFLGVNYYTRGVVIGTEDSVLPDFSPLATFDPLTLEQGEVYPEGMYEVLTLVRDRYPGLPIVISENGADVVTYPETDRFLAEHLQYLQRALQDGVDVRGYYYWSLIDNYEWNHGMSMRFGLFEIDPGDVQKTRKPRPVTEVYSRVTAEHGLPSDVIERFPIAERD